MWVQGVAGIDVPEWAAVLQLSELWHVPPWVIDEGCSQDWWERTNAYYRAKTEARNG